MFIMEERTITVPKWQQFMIPVLKILSNGETISRMQILKEVAREMGLTASQRAEVWAEPQLVDA
jgi:restriction endonuclease Mrr